VLVEGDDFNDPVCDSARGILDGHIHLSRLLAHRNHFPAIDVLSSISRVMMDIVDPKHIKAANALRDLLSEYNRNEDIISIGSYVPGMNQKLDQAIQLMPVFEKFLKQDRFEKSDLNDSLAQLYSIIDEVV
jgi:flagellum-specific ATP synthase